MGTKYAAGAGLFTGLAEGLQTGLGMSRQRAIDQANEKYRMDQLAIQRAVQERLTKSMEEESRRASERELAQPAQAMVQRDPRLAQDLSGYFSLVPQAVAAPPGPMPDYDSSEFGAGHNIELTKGYFDERMQGMLRSAGKRAETLEREEQGLKSKKDAFDILAREYFTDKSNYNVAARQLRAAYATRGLRPPPGYTIDQYIEEMLGPAPALGDMGGEMGAPPAGGVVAPPGAAPSAASPVDPDLVPLTNIPGFVPYNEGAPPASEAATIPTGAAAAPPGKGPLPPMLRPMSEKERASAAGYQSAMATIQKIRMLKARIRNMKFGPWEMSKSTGPVMGRWRNLRQHIGSSGDPDFVELNNAINFELIEHAHQATGAQRGFAELAWIKSTLPSVNQNDEDFEAALNAYETALTQAHDADMAALSEAGFATPGIFTLPGGK